MSQPPSVSQDKYVVRLPDGMREWIKVAADAANRSMNAEIVHRLEESFRFDTLDSWDRFRRNALEEKRAGAMRDVEVLSGVMEDLADQIAARIVAQLGGTASPPSQPVGAVAVRKRAKARGSKRAQPPDAS